MAFMNVAVVPTSARDTDCQIDGWAESVHGADAGKQQYQHI